MRSGWEADADCEIRVFDGMGHEPERKQAQVLQCPRHGEVANVHRAQPETLDEVRNDRLGPGVVSGNENVQRLACQGTASQDVGELGVERLEDCRVGRHGPGDFLRAKTVRRRDEAHHVSGDRIGDIDEDLAGQRVAILVDYFQNGGIGHRQDDDVAERVAPNFPTVVPVPICSASVCALVASRLLTSTLCPARVARPPIAAAMPPEPIMLMLLMVVFPARAVSVLAELPSGRRHLK